VQVPHDTVVSRSGADKQDTDAKHVFSAADLMRGHADAK